MSKPRSPFQNLHLVISEQTFPVFEAHARKIRYASLQLPLPVPELEVLAWAFLAVWIGKERGLQRSDLLGVVGALWDSTETPGNGGTQPEPKIIH